MIFLGLFLAFLLCGALTLASYLHLLYVEAVRFRPKAKSFAFFDKSLQPLLGLDAEDGQRRYAVVRQVALILLALDLLLLVMPHQGIQLAVLEALVLGISAMVLFAHILPSILFTRTYGKWALRIVPLAKVLAWIIFPVLILTRFASSVAELGAEEPAAKPASTPSEDIEVLLDAGQEEGLIGEDDRKLIQSVVEFGDKTVREVMTPRPQIVAIESSRSVEQLRELLISSQFSRIPVYENSIDHVVGFVHSRDALEMEEAKRAQIKVRELVRPVPLVPESKPIHVLLREMQESNIHMAVVVDEYGQTAGLATLEDLMEEIVGEIRDESEPDEDVVEQPDHSFVASGNLDLDRLEELVGFRPAAEFETTTVGGLVCEHLGQVPNPGATVQLDGIEIEVLSADERRVNSVRFRRVEPKESANEKEPVAQEEDRHSAEGAA